ncbi:MAG: S-layer homology domain-containing protein [Aeromicrobium sp.]|uniref:S-layer homology domain-containing protein n=1 Tax=Aeromicrobium sp. TaxID=1871063 RepID=UPI0039E3DE28
MFALAVSVLNTGAPMRPSGGAAPFLSVAESTPGDVEETPPAVLDPEATVDLEWDTPVQGADALDALGDALPAVAAHNGLTAEQLSATLTSDATVGVDPTGALFAAENEALHDHGTAEGATEHAGHAGEAGAVTEEAADYVSLQSLAQEDQSNVETAEAVADLSDTFALHSNLGAQRTIFLDFDGHTVSGTAWNDLYGVADGFQRGYSQDSDYTTFNTAELNHIQQVWAYVAEDYSAFDVDVTTEDPGTAAIERSNSSDLVYGARALISSTTTFPSSCGTSCAGIAYIGNFDAASNHAYYQTAWIKASTYTTNAPAMALVVSHEIGHNGGLYHTAGQTDSYYSGHDNWGPIMGAPYTRAVTQWTDQDDTRMARDASQSGPDITVLNLNGLTSRTDEAAGTITSAPTVSDSGASGFVTSSSDVDVWKLGACSGSATVVATPAAQGPNVDLKLTILSSAGATLATNDPTSSSTGSWASGTLVATGMDATASVTNSGVLYAQVQGTGVTSRYSAYGSVGAYTLTWSCAGTTTSTVANTVLPAITGTAQVGQTLTASAGTWTPSSGVSFTYQWLADGVALSGASTSTLALTSTHLGKKISVRVTGSRTGYESASATSAQTAAVVPACVFSDVTSGHVFQTEICWLAASGVTTGYSDGTFRPSQSVLREQVAAFLYRFMNGGANPSTSDPVATFSDVASSHVFTRHIRWLTDEEITTGYSDNTFRPSQPVRREQVAAFLYRLAGSPTFSVTSCGLTDVPSSHVFAKEICWLKSTGITTGYSDNTFRPSQPVLREQIAAFLYRFDAKGY